MGNKYLKISEFTIEGKFLGFLQAKRQKNKYLQLKIESGNVEIQLPGGGWNENESLIHALYREVLEETGWGINILKKEGIFQRFTYMPEYKIWAHKICHVYRCAATFRKTEKLEENHRLLIMNKKKALETIVDTGFKYFIQNI